MKLLNDNVLLEEVQTKEDVTEGGIVLPSVGAQCIRAKVIARGPGGRRADDGVFRHHMCVNIDDEVILPRGSGTPIIIDGKQMIVVKEDEILVCYPAEKPDAEEEEEES